MTKTIQIHQFTFEASIYDDCSIDDTIEISCVAEAQDYHLSDRVIECDITKDEAVELIQFLKDSFTIS